MENSSDTSTSERSESSRFMDCVGEVIEQLKNMSTVYEVAMTIIEAVSEKGRCLSYPVKLHRSY